MQLQPILLLRVQFGLLLLAALPYRIILVLNPQWGQFGPLIQTGQILKQNSCGYPVRNNMVRVQHQQMPVRFLIAVRVQPNQLSPE
ncbi:hypothetical protein D3C74_252320 [compost metagenome]